MGLYLLFGPHYYHLLRPAKMPTDDIYRVHVYSIYIKLDLPPTSVPPCPLGISPFLPTTNSL